MKKFALGCGGLVVLGIIVLMWAMGGYNGLVSLSQNTDAKWAEVQTQYQRRYDLIPNLVSTVQGAANFEKSTLENVVKARASVGQVTMNPQQAPTDPAQLQAFNQAQGQLGAAVSRLLVVSENYPQLRSNENFLGLQTQLEGTENRIGVARKDFNEAVQVYNTAVQRFPAALYAGMFGFHPKPYFQAVTDAQSAPPVRFDSGNNNSGSNGGNGAGAAGGGVSVPATQK